MSCFRSDGRNSPRLRPASQAILAPAVGRCAVSLPSVSSQSGVTTVRAINHSSSSGSASRGRAPRSAPQAGSEVVGVLRKWPKYASRCLAFGPVMSPFLLAVHVGPFCESASQPETPQACAGVQPLIGPIAPPPGAGVRMAADRSSFEHSREASVRGYACAFLGVLGAVGRVADIVGCAAGEAGFNIPP